MQILVEIPDNQAAFGLKVLESLSFVQDTKLFSQSAIELWEDLKGASSEVAAHKSGKLKLKTAEELLNIL